MTDNRSEFLVGLYIRLSREDGDKEESNSVTNQRSMLLKFTHEQKDLILQDTYIDDGYSGTNFQRPDFERMIQDIKRKRINCVIVKDLSRFGRDYIETGHYIERFFVQNNIRFIAVNDGIDSYYSQYDLLMPIKNIFNQQYAQDISQKVQSSFKVRQKEGQFIGAFPSYGYKRNPTDKHSLIIDEYAAGIVLRIFQSFANGKGKLMIAKHLNAEGILCPTEYKLEHGMNYRNSNKLLATNYWTYSTINHILRNQMYLGDMVQGKTSRKMKGKARYLPKEEWIVVKERHPAIINKELWERVQHNLKSQTSNSDHSQREGMFAGVLKCGDCKRALSKNKNLGQIHYVCGTYKNYGKERCTSHRINQSILEEIIMMELNEILGHIENISDLIREQIVEGSGQNSKISKENELIQIDKEMEKVKRNKRYAYQDYREGLINQEEYLEYRKVCDDKLTYYKKHRVKLLQSEKEANEITTSSWIKRVLENGVIDELDRSIIVKMVDTIYVYEDRTIRIIYNFSGRLVE